MRPPTGPPTPRTWLADKYGRWPFDALVEDAPVEALAAREAARRLATTLDAPKGELQRALEVLELPDDAHRAAAVLLSGTAYPDFADLANLEVALEMRLWPDPRDVPPAAHQV